MNITVSCDCGNKLALNMSVNFAEFRCKKCGKDYFVAENVIKSKVNKLLKKITIKYKIKDSFFWV